MTAVTFDTLKLAQKLRDKAKFTPEQAEQTAVALADAFGDWQEQQQLATKSDMAAVKTDLRELELRLESKLETTKAELIKWVVGIGFAQVAMILAVLKTFH